MFIFPGIGIGKETLSLWSINPDTPFGNLTDQMAGEFSKKSHDFQLEPVHFTNNFYKNNLRAAMESGETPDIFHNWGENSLRPYVQDGKILALDNIDEKLKNTFLPIAFNPVTFNGKIYGVPYSGLAGVFFWYRKDVFRKLQLNPPTTWEEFLAVGEILKQNGIVPIALANKNKWPGSFFYMYLVDRIGGPHLFSDAFGRKANQSFKHPAFVEAGKLIQDLVQRDFFPKSFNRIRDEQGGFNSLIISGQAGMYLMGTWFLSVLNKLPPEITETFDFFVFPKIKGGQGSIVNIVGSPGQDYLSISTKCKHPNAAMKFLNNHINSDKYFRELAKQGLVPPIINAEDYLSDPISKKVAQVYNKAKHIQIYYDQVMPPTMAEAHKLLIQQLFELHLTPEQVAQSHEDLMQLEVKK